MSIVLNNIKRAFIPGKDSEVRALRGVNLEIKDGEMLAIMGASGSGKSTLLHILGCLDSGFEGEYILNGKDIKSLTQKELADLRNNQVGIVLQNFGLINNMTVRDNIAVPCYLGGKIKSGELSEKIRSLAERLGIRDKLRADISELSGGQKQRTAIARALIKSPKIILADEPTGALDKATSQEIVRLLKDLNSEGYTIIIVTHDPEVAKSCQKTVIIEDGRIALENILQA